MVSVDFSNTFLFDKFRRADETVLGPVTPGDQKRPYKLRETQKTDLEDSQDILLPSLSEITKTLKFSLIVTESFGNVLLVSGEISSGDESRLNSFLASNENPIDAIALHSPGGLVHEAILIGQLIRRLELKTIVSDNAACLSSCPYMLAGGVERLVNATSIVGLHQHYYEQPGYLPVFLAVEQIQTGQANTMAYLKEMGVDPGITIFGLKTPPDEIYVLVPEELMEYGLATEIIK